MAFTAKPGGRYEIRKLGLLTTVEDDASIKEQLLDRVSRISAVAQFREKYVFTWIEDRKTSEVVSGYKPKREGEKYRVDTTKAAIFK